MCSTMHIGLCIVSTKYTDKLKLWILRTRNKRMTRAGITHPFLSKSVKGLIMLFNCLLDLRSLIFQNRLFHISMCQHRTLRMIMHSPACFILRTTMAEIGSWAFKWTRLVDTSFLAIFFLVNSQPVICHSLCIFNNAPFSFIVI
jgi:hypothetical protein